MSQKEKQIVTKSEIEEEGEDYAGAGAGVDQKVWDCGSPLYDSYELASLTHLIDRHMAVFAAAPSSSASGQLTKSTEESNGKGRQLWRKKVGARRRRMGNVVRAAWVAVANFRSKRESRSQVAAS